MPIYPYKCLECDAAFDEMHSMKEAPLEVKCKCGAVAYRDWNSYGNIDATMKENTRWSWTMGVNIDKIPEMLKKYPDRVYNPETGQLKVKNRIHKLKLLAEHGMEEY